MFAWTSLSCCRVANPFFASTPAPLAFELYVAGWVALVLGLAVLSFRAREP